MTQRRAQAFAALIEAADCLYLENVALKIVLEHRALANWQKLVNKLMSAPEMLAGIHLKFRNLYEHLERVPDPAAAFGNLAEPSSLAKEATLTFSSQCSLCLSGEQRSLQSNRCPSASR
jgi:hypothetical protein